MGVVIGTAESARIRYRCLERLADVGAKSAEHRSVEHARCDRIDSDESAGEIASGYQGDAMDRGFACRVGGLTDLAVECCCRGGEYYRPAFAVDWLGSRDLSGPSRRTL